jgi:hypothetical protein
MESYIYLLTKLYLLRLDRIEQCFEVVEVVQRLELVVQVVVNAGVSLR